MWFTVGGCKEQCNSLPYKKADRQSSRLQEVQHDVPNILEFLDLLDNEVSGDTWREFILG